MIDKLRPVICAECGCSFGMPEDFYQVCWHSPEITFYCPYGHSLVFPKRPFEPESVQEEEKKEEAKVLPFRIIEGDKE